MNQKNENCLLFDSAGTDYIRELVSKGGPDKEDYLELGNWYRNVREHVNKGVIPVPSKTDIMDLFGAAMSVETLQGWVVNTPKGYHGDYRVIDKIYTSWLSDNDDLVKWDQFYHSQSAPKAVRNRKLYLKKLLKTLDDELSQRDRQQGKVLNVGSGPCRDINEYFDGNPDSLLTIDALDMDSNAHKYAQWLLVDHSHRVNFLHKNVFRFATDIKYDLVWSAGLFDYFDDKAFTHVLTKLYSCVDHDGELIIGNFSENNPSQDYMEFGGWILNHRSTSDLLNLVDRANLKCDSVQVDQEPEGVNYFLRVRKI